jgi:hypothetical protein
MRGAVHQMVQQRAAYALAPVGVRGACRRAAVAMCGA